MSLRDDDLHRRAGLPAAFRYLEQDCARADWPVLRLHPSALHWLAIHAWFRGALQDLADQGEAWREQRQDAAGYHAEALPRLGRLLGHLQGHHHIESEAYFPALARLEPDMAQGFALLDRDHEAIEGLMAAMAQAAVGLDRAAAGAQDLTPHAAALVAQIERGGGLIGRHLTDEEEIVVPVFTLRGDPFDDY